MKPGSGGLSGALRIRAWRVGIIALPIQVCYFTIFYLGLRTGRVFPLQSLLLLVLALWLYLAYIVLINDLADRGIDAAVGKGTVERGHGLAPRTIAAFLVAIVAGAGVTIWAIGGSLLFDGLWALSFALGTLYSLPPFSLKQRGFIGLAVDSVMEKPLPILTIFAFFGYYGPEIVIFPVLGELLDAVFKHQARDRDRDVEVGVRTFAVAIGKRLSDSALEAIHKADVLMVAVAFLTVGLALPSLAAPAWLELAALVLAFAVASLMFRDFFFHPTPGWSSPLKWEDPPFVVLFNSGFQALLVPTLGFALAVQSHVYAPLLLLFLVSLAPYLFAYAVVALVRMKLIGAK